MHTLQVTKDSVLLEGKAYPLSEVRSCKIVNIDKEFMDSREPWLHTVGDAFIQTGWMNSPEFYICLDLTIGEERFVSPVSYKLVRFNTDAYHTDKETAERFQKQICQKGTL